jgi:hypothetical protein
MIAIQQISVPWLQCDYFIFFFLYILSGSIYRQQLFRLLKLNKRNNEILPFHQMPVTNGNILTIKSLNDTHV